MALDGTFLHLVKEELNTLCGSRVIKIHQPSREEIILTFRDGKLLLCANAVNARVHLTETTPENPKHPPMFCMLLRKHFLNAKLLIIEQDGLERILKFSFEHTNEIGDIEINSVFIEIMGKYSNIILTKKTENKEIIIDCLKRSEDAFSGERLLLPSAEYIPPKKDKRVNFLTDNFDTENIKTTKDILNHFEGVAPTIANEWLAFATRNNEVDPVRLAYIIKATRDNPPYFNVLFDNNEPKKFSYIKLSTLISLYNEKKYETACESLEKFFEQKTSLNRAKQYSETMLKMLVTLTERISKRINHQKIELENCSEKDKFRVSGELIFANIYNLKQGDIVAKLDNFYTGETVNIDLDPQKSPADNAKNYFKKYKKLVTAEKILKEQIENGLKELDYIESVFDTLTRAVTENEIAQIRLELEQTGYIKRTGNNKQKITALKPIEYEYQGFKILVGRNNIQNDLLTKSADKTDIWLHTQKIHGSHVIIKGRDIPDEVIAYAAKIAAYHSKARNSSQVPVDYTFVKQVKKPNGSKPGFVIYFEQQTIYTEPINTEEYK
ncbi:MAG: NFACT family protein [Oscillospiraceae bacterium]|nr:NFACT family protein [Oscillospiraceae bacterium]